jgi:hypothetical protein
MRQAKEENRLLRFQQAFNKLPSFVRLLLRVMPYLLFLIGLCLAGIAVIFLSYKLQRPLPPLGYADFFDSHHWNAENIGAFIGIPIPTDSVNLQIDGRLGSTGSYGIDPRLAFTFRSSPQTAMNFINAFCDGVFYPGYNPLIAIDSSSPVPGAVLVRANGTIHYSISPDVPETTMGNRCAQEQWIIDIMIETADPTLYTLSYRLNDNATGDPSNSYPHAETITPLDPDFRLYATGLHEEQTTSGEVIYQLVYPTICLQTQHEGLIFDYWTHHAADFEPYLGSSIALFIDGERLPPARVTANGALIDISDDETVLRRGWNYCFTQDWRPGTHTVEMRVSPLQGPVRTFEWSFEVEEDGMGTPIEAFPSSDAG